VLVVGLLLSQSRGGVVAAVVMLIAGVCLAGRLRVWIGALCAVMIAVGVGYYVLFASEAIHARVNSLLRINAYGGLSDGSGRKDLWKVAVELIADHPILGVGARNYRSVTGESQIVHNTYLEIQAGLGALGMLLFLAVIVGAIVMSLRGIRYAVATNDVEGEFRARGVLVGIVGLLSSYVFISGEFQPQLWWLLGLAVACGGPPLREPSQESSSNSADSELASKGTANQSRLR
jgi:O-antigen ligase